MTCALAAAVQIELGETPAPKRSEHTAIRTKPTLHAPARIDACLVAMRRIPIRDHHDGSLRLYACACRAVEFDLDDDDAVLVIRRYMRERPFRREWSDDDIVRRMRDAERRCQRGLAIALAEDGLIALGGCDPVTGRLVLSPKRTIPTARAFVREFYDHPEARTIHSYAGDLWEWRQNRYQLVEPAAVKRSMQDWLHGALRYQAKNKVIELVPFESNPLSVNTAIETLHNEVHLSSDTQSPSWLIDDNTRPPASEILVGQASFWHLPTSTRLSGTPLLFTVNSLSFDPDPSAPAPGEWLTFLERLFGADRQQIELLQDWFGYCLTGNTSQQKILLLVGPKRSGKGTIARVLTVLVGPGNLCGPTTSSLAGPFGLQPLLGKSLAIVSDARFSGENVTTVVERLLCISGEDTLTVDRKFQSSVTLKLPTRFMFLSNELPRLNDASAALAGRFLILRLTESFYGREDLGLGKRLLAEMPGILNWAIEGWKRLHRRGRFVQPSSVAELVRDLEELASPVSAFIRDECVLGAGYRISTGDLYQAWRCWCENDGRSTPSTKHVFGRDLIAAAPQVVTRRGTDMQRFYDGITLRSTIESIQRFDCRDYRVSSNCTRMRSEKE